MPYVLKHKETGELLSCFLTNIYDFTYHGVKAWEDERKAEEERGSFTAGLGYNEPWLWEVTELEENQVKMCNVKLNNNPAKRVYLTAEGRIEARTEG